MNIILNIFTPLYSWCSSLGEELQNSDSEHCDYYRDYFENTSVCGTVFLIAFLTSLLIAIIYYFIFCNKFFDAAKRYIWAIVLGLCFVITLFITPNIIIGKYDTGGLIVGQNHTHLFNQAKKTLESKMPDIEDDEALEETIQNAEDYANLFFVDKPNAIGMFIIESKIPLRISLWNAIYSIVLFILFSLLFKGHTIHGKAIPF